MPFADDVRAGLTARPKTLPPKYFYDELGSALFEAICLLPEYYLTRAEAEILTARAAEIVALVEPARLVELGSGTALKTRFLIEAGLTRGALSYSAIDISETVLLATAKALASQYPALAVRSYQGDYYDGLRQLSADQPSQSNGRTLALFLGSNIGNFDPPQALRLVRAVRAASRSGDALLLGTDLKKDPAVLEAAYDDAIGLTAAFNRNILGRINRELGGHFDIGRFAHRARYDAEAGRIEMHLESQTDQTVAIDELDLSVRFGRSETIHTESSYKFSRDDVERLARESGFVLEQTWTDDGGRFACNLLRCAP
ncbi:MAG: L-histidine N(alpha)-methyltransferase [Candidatus Eremiobacteraeota bacterium]|nr:L-histidine N(alpha)-methyltransferase [Candidatus Eremiobacteraeota bacterium]MBV8340553.1 L-histidine N(alpha)-methyltransferase [Candidatus Eremiobacteraeota bacterium]